MALSLFASPLNPLIIRALAQKPLGFADLREVVGGPAQTTLRGYLSHLIDIGVVVKVERRIMPLTVSHELTGDGRALLFVLDVLERWLAQAPRGEIKLGTEPAKAAVKALAEGWDAAILHALAAEPLSLTELDNLIHDVSYPSLERRLATMRVTRQIEAVPGEGNATPYTVTDWGRKGIVPLAAAGRWERLHASDRTEPVTWLEVEAAFLMATPLLELPAAASGECVLAVDTKGEERRIAGVRVTIENGRVVACDPNLQTEPPTFALGSPAAWLEAVFSRQADRLHISGDRRLVSTLITAIHVALFPAV